MVHVSAIIKPTMVLCVRGGKWGQFTLAVAIGTSLALISWQAGVLDGSTDIFGGVTGSATSASNPGALVAVGAAFIIGAAMIVLPCGFPSVFAMPSILSSRKRLHQRTALSLVFVAASALPLAALGVGLAFGGDAILSQLDSMKAKMTFSVVLIFVPGRPSDGLYPEPVGALPLAQPAEQGQRPLHLRAG